MFNNDKPLRKCLKDDQKKKRKEREKKQAKRNT